MLDRIICKYTSEEAARVLSDHARQQLGKFETCTMVVKTDADYGYIPPITVTFAPTYEQAPE